MKNFIVSIISLLSLTLCVNLNAQNKLTIIIDNIEEPKGSILISLFDSSDSFLKKGLMSQKIEVKGKKVEIVFDNLPKGKYAASLFLDENNNGKLDKGMFGIPKEKYGFSNNAKGIMGPPNFEDCVFEIKKDTKISIEL